jgi:hypothetical protein
VDTRQSLALTTYAVGRNAIQFARTCQRDTGRETRFLIPAAAVSLPYARRSARTPAAGDASRN